MSSDKPNNIGKQGDQQSDRRPQQNSGSTRRFIHSAIPPEYRSLAHQTPQAKLEQQLHDLEMRQAKLDNIIMPPDGGGRPVETDNLRAYPVFVGEDHRTYLQRATDRLIDDSTILPRHIENISPLVDAGNEDARRTHAIMQGMQRYTGPVDPSRRIYYNQILASSLVAIESYALPSETRGIVNSFLRDMGLERSEAMNRAITRLESNLQAQNVPENRDSDILHDLSTAMDTFIASGRLVGTDVSAHESISAIAMNIKDALPGGEQLADREHHHNYIWLLITSIYTESRHLPNEHRAGVDRFFARIGLNTIRDQDLAYWDLQYRASSEQEPES